MGMWRTKLNSRHNHIPVEVKVGDDIKIKLVRGSGGEITVSVDAPRDKAITTSGGGPLAPDAQGG